MQAPCPDLSGRARFFFRAPCYGSLGAAEDIDAGEDTRGCRVAAVDHLVRLALAAVERAVDLERAGVADCPQAPPERRRDATVVRILHHPGAPPLLDQLAPLATELEFVARVIDRPGDVGAHQDAAPNRGNHGIERVRAG